MRNPFTSQEKSLLALIEAIDETGKGLAAETADMEIHIAAIVSRAGGIQSVVNEAVQKFRPLLGNSERTARLHERAQMIVAKALRIHLAGAFRKAGLTGIFADLRDEKDLSFSNVVGDFLTALSAAVSTLLPATEGRKKYVAKNNIAGLHGLTITGGEILVLDPRDDNVKFLISSGALVELIDAQASGARA